MRDVVKISWSGGKDSTCAVFKHIEAGHICKIVNYIPMLTDDIPLIIPEHYAFIKQMEMRFEKYSGVKCYNAVGESYVEFFHRIKRKGPHIGFPYGFPCYIHCAFKFLSKIRALNNLDVGFYDYSDIGIAFDEQKRKSQLNDKKRSILCEQGITESEAMNFCIMNKCLSPNYNFQTRDGCCLCPNAKADERKRYFECYPEAKKIVSTLESISRNIYPNFSPLRNNKFFSDEW